jgi:hypothetical protein
MPIAMENALKTEALKKFGTSTGPRANRLIFGTMRKEGWRPGVKGLTRPQGLGGIKTILHGGK